MMSEDEARQGLCPHLLEVLDKSLESGWFYINQLVINDIVQIRTPRSIYYFTVENPKRNQGYLLGTGQYCQFCKRDTRAWFHGTSLTGTGNMVKTGAMVASLGCLVFALEGEKHRLLIPRVQSVFLNDVPVCFEVGVGQ